VWVSVLVLSSVVLLPSRMPVLVVVVVVRWLVSVVGIVVGGWVGCW
jgi:hypothetical protein